MLSVVTGAAGFIGSRLCGQLLSEGQSVVGIDCFTDYYPKSRKLSNLKPLLKQRRFRFLRVDLSKECPPSAFRGADYVFHLAAQPGVRDSWGQTFAPYVRNNVVATQKLLEVVKRTEPRRIIYASSSSIYGDAESLPTSEDALPRPVSPYGVTKLAAEHLFSSYAKAYGVPSIVLRYFTVYGPGQRPDMAFFRIIDKVSKREQVTIYGSGEQSRDFTFIEDTVRATKMAAKAKAGRVFNVGSGRIHSVNEAIALIESLLGTKAKVKHLSKALGDVTKTSADISRIRKAVGYRPTVGFEDGLRKQVEWQTGRAL
jgi:UDP-glucose 4-epimerase